MTIEVALGPKLGVGVAPISGARSCRFHGLHFPPGMSVALRQARQHQLWQLMGLVCKHVPIESNVAVSPGRIAGR